MAGGGRLAQGRGGTEVEAGAQPANSPPPPLRSITTSPHPSASPPPPPFINPGGTAIYRSVQSRPTTLLGLQAACSPSAHTNLHPTATLRPPQPTSCTLQ